MFITWQRKVSCYICDLSNRFLTKFIFLLFPSYRQIKTHRIHNVQSLQVPKYSVKSRYRDNVIMSHNQSILFSIIAYHVRLISSRMTPHYLAVQFSRKSREFSCDSSSANDGSLIKSLRRPSMMIF